MAMCTIWSPFQGFITGTLLSFKLFEFKKPGTKRKYGFVNKHGDTHTTVVFSTFWWCFRSVGILISVIYPLIMYDVSTLFIHVSHRNYAQHKYTFRVFRHDFCGWNLFSHISSANHIHNKFHWMKGKAWTAWKKSRKYSRRSIIEHLHATRFRSSFLFDLNFPITNIHCGSRDFYRFREIKTLLLDIDIA